MTEEKDLTQDVAVDLESTAENGKRRTETRREKQSNPLGGEIDILVSMPESLEVKMVNASSLSEYEIWSFMSSFLASISTGFWVAFVQNTNKDIDSILKWNSIIFTILLLITTIVTFVYRYNLKKKSKSKSMKLKA